MSLENFSIAVARQQAGQRLEQVKARQGLPQLVPHTAVPKRSIYTEAGFAAMIHALTHIEFNAINLALDALWRFDGMPERYYQDWQRVADEEQMHFDLLSAFLHELGYEYGDFVAHAGLWQMCERTEHDIVARMALVPRTLEARGLDATPVIQTKLKKMNTAKAQRADAILAIILRDEVGHVAIGNHWYRWLCAQHQLDPLAHYLQLALEHDAPKLKPPLNIEARLRAGFSLEELAQMSR